MSGDPPVAPCPSCDSRIFWRDNQVGKIHCVGCFEPASRVIVARWLHVVAVETSEPDQASDVDLFGDPMPQPVSYHAVEIDMYGGATADDSDAGGDIDAEDSPSGFNRSKTDLIASMCSDDLDQAIMWLKSKRLSGEIAITHGRNIEAEILQDEKRPPAPKNASEFFLLKNGRIVEGRKRASKHKTVKAMTWTGSHRWYKVKNQIQPPKPAKAKSAKAN